MNPPLRLWVRSMECGFQVGVLLRIGPFVWTMRFPNPFRRNLTDAEWRAGRNRWRWPVSTLARQRWTK